MTEWRWLSLELTCAIHDRQLAEHGGDEGIIDLGLVEGALARPQHLAAYDSPDVFDLAASYCWGIAKDHGFVDGNKRTGWVLARVFLADHGVKISFDKAAAVLMVESATSGVISQKDLADWLRGCAVE